MPLGKPSLGGKAEGLRRGRRMEVGVEVEGDEEGRAGPGHCWYLSVTPQK